ncbi:aquaporin family protein [Deinococcus sp. KSM4-11]|uniref:MIP/aquaporin family protein n=1 Tax=Deinococcus sp. KSM4-11 TaxID=2568654 RepID=UPI0010A371C0|nr:aquaporin [Deinococcus sp. KSM4-11]THF84389.1 aquaporin family protein [Deinococcus sp. KSM4-11]
MDSLASWRRWLVEGLGAALIVLADLGADALFRAHLLPGFVAHMLVPGTTVLALIVCFSDVSGAHFNPAVSLAFTLRGSFPARALPGYVIAQVVGATLVAWALHAGRLLSPEGERLLPLQQALVEGGCTTLLILLVLATAKRHAAVGSEAALFVGLTVVLLHTLGSPLTALSLNPARALGPALVEGQLADTWPHWVMPLGSAIVAAVLTSVVRGGASREEAEAAQGETQSD